MKASELHTDAFIRINDLFDIISKIVYIKNYVCCGLNSCESSIERYSTKSRNVITAAEY